MKAEQEIVERYIDERLRYTFTAGPDKVRSFADALQYGINCVSLAHLALDDLFDLQLPPNLYCWEMYHDREFFTTRDVNALTVGDLVWFGTTSNVEEINAFQPQFREGQIVNWDKSPVKHVGMYVGNDAGVDSAILHASDVEGTCALWPLERFRSYGKYQAICGVSRSAVAVAELH